MKERTKLVLLLILLSILEAANNHILYSNDTVTVKYADYIYVYKEETSKNITIFFIKP